MEKFIQIFTIISGVSSFLLVVIRNRSFILFYKVDQLKSLQNKITSNDLNRYVQDNIDLSIIKRITKINEDTLALKMMDFLKKHPHIDSNHLIIYRHAFSLQNNGELALNFQLAEKIHRRERFLFKTMQYLFVSFMVLALLLVVSTIITENFFMAIFPLLLLLLSIFLWVESIHWDFYIQPHQLKQLFNDYENQKTEIVPSS